MTSHPKDTSGIEDRLKEISQRPLTFVLAGRTGVGKSSTINSLLGQQIAPVGHYTPTTVTVSPYTTIVYGIKSIVFDTPGLCDDLQEVGNDEKYVSLIRDNVKSLDCLWYVTRLDDKRVSSDEKRGIKVLTDAFGAAIWNNAILVFTFAGNVSAVEFKEALKKRTELMRIEIAKYTGPNVSNQIPGVAVDNKSETTPDNEKWLGELFSCVAVRISENKALPFIFAIGPRINSINGEKWPGAKNYPAPPQPISLTQSQLERVNNHLDSIQECREIGEFIGGLFGRTGKRVGGAVGALIGWAWSKLTGS